jgi:shikimate kinase
VLSMHCFLIGMTGAGKSSLGRKAAADLQVPFVDTDERVAALLGMNQSQLSSLPEELLRNVESGVLMSLAGEEASIVSTGSGLVTNRENVHLMQNHGIIIHIDRPLDQIMADAKAGQGRFQSGSALEDVIFEYNQRIGFYRAAADYTLDNSHGILVGVLSLTRLIQKVCQPQSELPELEEEQWIGY